MESVEKRADRKIVALLVSAGVDVAGRSAPTTGQLFDDEAEPVDDPRGSQPSGPPFSIDDVIDFHYQLEDDRSIREFLAAQ